MGNLKILIPQKTVNMHFFQKIKKILSDNVSMMIYVEKIWYRSKTPEKVRARRPIYRHLWGISKFWTPNNNEYAFFPKNKKSTFRWCIYDGPCRKDLISVQNSSNGILNVEKYWFSRREFPLLEMKPKRSKWYFWGVSQDFFFMHRAYRCRYVSFSHTWIVSCFLGIFISERSFPSCDTKCIEYGVIIQGDSSITLWGKYQDAFSTPMWWIHSKYYFSIFFL